MHRRKISLTTSTCASWKRQITRAQTRQLLSQKIPNFQRMISNLRNLVVVSSYKSAFPSVWVSAWTFSLNREQTRQREAKWGLEIESKSNRGKKYRWRRGYNWKSRFCFLAASNYVGPFFCDVGWQDEHSKKTVYFLAGCVTEWELRLNWTQPYTLVLRHKWRNGNVLKRCHGRDTRSLELEDVAVKVVGLVGVNHSGCSVKRVSSMTNHQTLVRAERRCVACTRRQTWISFWFVLVCARVSVLPACFSFTHDLNWERVLLYTCPYMATCGQGPRTSVSRRHVCCR